jgi:hypothetical protein
MIYIFIILCWALSGFFEAVKDVLAFKFKTSRFRKLNPEWWNPSRSWRNKYRNRLESEGERFPGSTHIFSFITDAWHCCHWLSILFSLIPLGVAVQSDLTTSPVLFILFLILVLLGRQGVYRLFYYDILRIKKNEG